MNTHLSEDAKPSRPEEAPEQTGDLSRGEVTRLLQDWNDGDPQARNQLIELVYADLRRMAHQRLMRERIGHTMQTGTLADEVYLRLFQAVGVPCQNRREFFGIVARQMQQVLVDAARKRRFRKHGGERQRVPLETVTVAVPPPDLDWIALDEALEMLAAQNKDLHEVVALRFFAELTIEQTAEVLGVSPDTVKRRWTRAKLHLRHTLKGAGDGASPMATD